MDFHRAGEIYLLVEGEVGVRAEVEIEEVA